ncbi:AAA family ATPase [Treponema phagedenis]|uniref:AAA family ATPase n=2 Tax=Treponema phagedenis TaxID=162 RepID=UPI001FD0E1C6|nr:AAA family ATPase [Treponema phagedenis]
MRMSDVSIDNLSVKERLKEALLRFDISQTKAAKEMGYTSSVLSQYLNDTYRGDVVKVEEAIIKWIARKTENAGKKHVAIIETTAMRQMSRAIRLAHDEKDIALIVGDAGSGKTTTAEQYVRDNPRTSILIKCSGAMSKRRMTEEIARQIGLNTYRVKFDNLVDMVSEALAEKEAIVIIDEADSLRDDALEFSRRLINDLGETGLVLIGLPGLAARIQNLKNDHRQLESRIGVFLKLQGLMKVDAERITESVWPEVSQEITESIYEISKRDIRQFVKIINRSQNIMTANRLEMPNVEIIEMAGKMILRRNYIGG